MPLIDYNPGILGDRAFETAEADSDVTYALDPDLRITYCNPAWDAFALANNGKHLVRAYQTGFTLMYAIPGCLREFYRQAFQNVRSNQKPWEQIYECSSADTYRSFQMTIHPIAKLAGFLVVNRLMEERPHSPERVVHLPNVALYKLQGGFISICCLCRRTQRATDPAVWDWVPAHLATPPLMTCSEICPQCFETHRRYYPIRD